jgi:predicted SAM-dependent methyltransferase
MNVVKLNLFCGPHAMPGWINYDAQPFPGVIAIDLRNVLPHESGSVDFIYSEHGIEHLTKHEQFLFLKECRRVLKVGGIMRISCPDLETIVMDYAAGRINRWSPGWSPETPCEMVNHGLSLWGHKYVLDFSEMKLQAERAGFNLIKRVAWHESDCEELCGLEARLDCGDLIVELS